MREFELDTHNPDHWYVPFQIFNTNLSGGGEGFSFLCGSTVTNNVFMVTFDKHGHFYHADYQKTRSHSVRYLFDPGECLKIKGRARHSTNIKTKRIGDILTGDVFWGFPKRILLIRLPNHVLWIAHPDLGDPPNLIEYRHDDIDMPYAPFLENEEVHILLK